LRRALLAALVGLAAWACDDDGDASGPADAGPSPCGEGPPRLTLGEGEVFAPLDPLELPLEAGFQGGFHVTVSIRADGPLDPDDVDVDLALFKDDWRVAHHVTLGWLLHIRDDGAYCEYPRARLVLQDEEGGLLAFERLTEVVDTPLRLAVSLRSDRGDLEDTFTITLRGADVLD
jgi:hypothetical protein